MISLATQASRLSQGTRDLCVMDRWYALYTKPKKEYQVDSFLRGKGIETYLPTVARRARRKDRPDRQVFFPCYLFARLDLTRVPRSSIDWMPGVRRIVGFGGTPAIVPDAMVNLLRERLSEYEEHPAGLFQKGDRVRIISGPLRDLEAVFDSSLSAVDRVCVLLDVMGRLTPVAIDSRQIVRL